MERDDTNELLDKENLISTSSKQNNLPPEIDEEPLLNSNESKEKILTLKKGYLVWKRMGLLAAISFGILLISLIIAIAAKLYFFFVITGIGGLGILFFFIFCCCCTSGFITIVPNEAVVYHYYGRYLGTVKDNGYFYGYPLAKTFRISLRSHQYNGSKLKVNERDGNPVELGIVVVWKVGDTFKAIFDVENYNSFIEAQSEAAIRYVGCKYPYEPIVPGEISLRSGHEIINKELKKELEKRIRVSGIIIEDARVTEISYGAEVAKMMLQKQASNATVFAKEAIVKGATKAVLNTINEFERNGIQMTSNEKASYITEMMNTLCTSAGVHKIMTN
jgi:regulator of protease activity HflC (stomatin/prohibitin superfamily)